MPPRLDLAKQGQHIPGNRTFIEGRSVLTSPDPQALLEGFAGTCEAVNNLPIGQPGSKERVEFGQVIGEYVNPGGTVSVPTTKGIIVYDRKGNAHIIPARP